MTQTLRPLEDAVSLIRKRPEMYLAAAPPSGRELAARVASDALLLCATRVRTERQGPWWVISADVDWLARPPLDDPTAEISVGLALAVSPPLRTTPAAFIRFVLPNPFEHHETGRLRTPPEENPMPVTVAPRPPSKP